MSTTVVRPPAPAAKLVTVPLLALAQFALNRQWTFRACTACWGEDVPGHPLA
jgi:putative flippase GtrA